MTFWFDTAHQSWEVAHDDDPLPRPGPRIAFAAALIVTAGAGACAAVLQILGSWV